jgi:hypothetical protein
MILYTGSNNTRSGPLLTPTRGRGFPSPTGWLTTPRLAIHSGRNSLQAPLTLLFSDGLSPRLARRRPADAALVLRRAVAFGDLLRMRALSTFEMYREPSS